MNDKGHRGNSALAYKNIGDRNLNAAADNSFVIVGGEKDSKQVAKR